MSKVSLGSPSSVSRRFSNAPDNELCRGEDLSVLNAKAYGYDGDEPEEAKKFIDQLFLEIQKISEVSWRRFCGVETPFLDRDFYVQEFIEQKSLNISEFYSLLLGKGALSWETLSQYLLQRWDTGAATDHVWVHQTVKAFCYELTKEENQLRANRLLVSLGATSHEVSWDSQESLDILYQAVENGRVDIVKCFLLHGVGIQAVLRLAVMKNQVFLVSYLLTRGAVIDIETLMLALEQESREMVWQLAQGGADLDGKIQDGDRGDWTTPLVHYVKKDRLRPVQILVDLGADLGFIDSQRKTAFMHALELNFRGIIRYLSQRIDLEERDGFGDSLLMHYARLEDLSVLQMLVSLGVQISQEALDAAGDNEEAIRLLQGVFEQKEALSTVHSIVPPIDEERGLAKGIASLKGS